MLSRRHLPGRVSLGGEGVAGLAVALLVGPGERHARRVAARFVDQVGLAADVGFAAGVAEAYAHRTRDGLGQFQRPPAEALRPEVLRLLAAAGDRPVLDHRRPGLAA